MSTRKNIDRLYLNKFEGAEVAPPAAAWQNISARLPEKEKRRLLPLWLRYAGTAAILLLLVSLGNSIFPPAAQTPVAGAPVTREDIHLGIRLAAAEFNETMLQASISLQQLIQWEGTAARTTSERLKAEPAEANLSGEESALAAKIGSPSEFQEPEAVISENVSEERTADYVFEETEPLDTPADFSEEINSGENAIAQQLAEELLEEKAEAEEAEGGRISISTRLAPVFYENMSSGNAIGARSAAGKPAGEVSLSYGVNLAYQVSDRLKLRSGISKLDLSFSTPGVPMATVLSSGAYVEGSDPALMARPVEGELKQQMDFIELPLELEYRLLDTRVGLNLIAGGSTLFLNSNNRSMDTGARTTQLGQAENMEKLNFSANLGLGLDYHLGTRVRLNLEPMFKYQLNSLSGETGIPPYYMAIYSGISFSF